MFSVQRFRLQSVVLACLPLMTWISTTAHAGASSVGTPKGADSARQASACNRPLYLTLDTGNMRDARPIAAFLKQRGIRATFFLANEKAYEGGYALDGQWADYWRERAKEGHVFGTHTLRHGRIFPDSPGAVTGVSYRPQFGQQAGERLQLSPTAFCEELRAVSTVFQSYTGQPVAGLWRAPGGKLSESALRAAQQCGYRHVGWSDSGFLGDELDSKRFPNAQLIRKALTSVKSGDILLAHLGIWSRQEHFLPAFEAIIGGLQDKGFCFRTLKDHPDYAAVF